ncbi:MAG: signal peptidase I [Actinomycetota bacterium]
MNEEAVAKSSPAGGAVRSPFITALRETAIVVVIAMVLSFIIKTLFVQAFFIPSPSMEDTLQRGDRVVVSKLTPGPFSLHRGDIVVFTDPGGWLGGSAPEGNAGLIRGTMRFVGLLPDDSGQHLIKRVIGLPGDRVRCCSPEGNIMVNDRPITEPYLKPDEGSSNTEFDITVPEGRIWVMGDNRANSADSRANDDGTGQSGSVPIDAVTGRAFALVWPLGRGSWLSRPYSFNAVPAP